MKRVIRILPIAIKEFERLNMLNRSGETFDRKLLKQSHLQAIHWYLQQFGIAWEGFCEVQGMPGFFRIPVYPSVDMSVRIQQTGFWKWKKETITVLQFSELTTS